MQRGFSLSEMLVVLALIGLAVGIALPASRAIRHGSRAAAGVRYMAGELQRARWQSVTVRRGRGLFFEADGRGWSWRVVEDGNGNGIRSAEIRRGTDPVISGPHRLGDAVEQTSLGFPGRGPFPAIPPRRGVITALDDPVKFGRSNIVSFSPLGNSSSGTLYVTDNDRALYGLVLFGPTTRIRVWRFDPRSGGWVL